MLRDFFLPIPMFFVGDILVSMFLTIKAVLVGIHSVVVLKHSLLLSTLMGVDESKILQTSVLLA